MSSLIQESTNNLKESTSTPNQTESIPYLIEPWDHQKKAIERASSLNEFALFFEMGTGKTMTAINILRHWYKQAGAVKPTLILCPQIVIDQWELEFTKHSKLSYHVVKLKGTGNKRLAILAEHLASRTPKIFVTNYETLAMPAIYALFLQHIKYLVCDESHKLKNPTSKRTKATIKLADVTEKRLILTGSPILNSPMDIYGQFRVLDKGKAFGNNFVMFRGKYFYDKNANMPPQQHWPDFRPRPGLEKAFNEIIYTKAMKADKSECLDLPPLVKVMIPVELTPEQRKAYSELEEQLITYLGDSACVVNMALTKILRLQQIVSGFIDLVEDSDENITGDHYQKELKNNRLDVLRELLEELTPQHKVIVWAPFRRNIKAIQRLCTELKLPHCAIYGGQSERERTESINNFRNDPSYRVCIANPKAGGVGLNLIEASYAIYYGRGYSLEDDLQSEARNYRGGSERHEKVTRIDLYTPGTVDEEIMASLHQKKKISENILAIRELLGK